MSGTAARKGLKVLLGVFVYGLTCAVVLGALGFWWAADQFQKPGPLSVTKIVMIERGAGLSGIANFLQSEGIITNPYVFMVGTRVMSAQKDLKAGEYEFAAQISMRAVMEKLRKGEVYERSVTIPEGKTSFEIVEILKAAEALSGDIASLPPEGSLLPNTYDYQKDEPRERVVGRMQQAMTDLLNTLWTGRAADLPLKTKEEALALASVVEKETGTAEERKRIAGVFINRLKQNIPLQSDPTVIYAITKGAHKNDGQGPLGRRLLTKDLEIDSPYNTYKYPGLPPGPIANPGKASIEAALNPEKHEFLYFVADGTGGHVFSKTLAEHNANVAKWRAIRKGD